MAWTNDVPVSRGSGLTPRPCGVGPVIEAAGQADRAGEERTELRRAIGPKLLLAFVVGDILGAGIYALVGEVGSEVGGAIWTAFLGALILASFTAFS